MVNETIVGAKWERKISDGSQICVVPWKGGEKQ